VSDDRLNLWEQKLAGAEADLRAREHRALQGAPTQEELRAFAAERDKIASDWDALADARDERGRARDAVALARDAQAALRNGTARHLGSEDNGAAVARSVAGTDRAHAAHDRADALDDRHRGLESRRIAAESRERPAADRDLAASREADLGREIAGLRDALHTRLTIGQAEGLLMGRHGLDADAAFRLLTRLSQEGHLKLRDVAARLVADAARPAEEQND
jgi:hypothetical protein